MRRRFIRKTVYSTPSIGIIHHLAIAPAFLGFFISQNPPSPDIIPFDFIKSDLVTSPDGVGLNQSPKERDGD